MSVYEVALAIMMASRNLQPLRSPFRYAFAMHGENFHRIDITVGFLEVQRVFSNAFPQSLFHNEH